MATERSGNPSNVSRTLTRTIVDATNATPIVVQTSVAHGFSDNDRVDVSGVTGNTAANKKGWTITVVDADHFSLNGSVGSGAYVAGGSARNRSCTPSVLRPDDGDLRSAASVNAAIDALADRTQNVALTIARCDTFPGTLAGTTHTWTVPEGCEWFEAEVWGGGGGGGGGPRGNSVDADDSFSTGGAGGGAGEYKRVRFSREAGDFSYGDVITITRGAGGAGGAGSAVGNGASGSDGVETTVVNTTAGTTLATARGGEGGGGGIRNIDWNGGVPGQFGGGRGGRAGASDGFGDNAISFPVFYSEVNPASYTPDGTPNYMYDEIRWFQTLVFGLGKGAGETVAVGWNYWGANPLRLKWQAFDGEAATSGANGADVGSKKGGLGGGGGGVIFKGSHGGVGGDGSPALAMPSSAAGGNGGNAVANTGAGGGGGAASGTSTNAGTGGNGGDGAYGGARIYYFGTQAVVA